VPRLLGEGSQKGSSSGWLNGDLAALQTPLIDGGVESDRNGGVQGDLDGTVQREVFHDLDVAILWFSIVGTCVFRCAATTTATGTEEGQST